jgi:hypothetical protein
MIPPPELPARFARYERTAWLLGAVCLAICILLMFIPATRGMIFPAYLVGFIFWFGIALGGTALTMLHHLTGGSWGLVIRRPLEAAALVISPLALLFAPILLGLDVLYPWARPEAAHDHVISIKASWLNPTAFILRTLFYFAAWMVLAWILSAWSVQQDSTTDRAPTRRLQRLSGPGLGLVFLTATFAAVDWLMSLEPDWYSTIYGAMVITGWGLATFSAMVIVVASLRRQQPLADIIRPAKFQDLGNLMLAFTMLWAYTSFMQYLIIWSGNLLEEIPWYLRRSRGGWQAFVTVLIVFHFFAPFLLLLSRDMKRRAKVLRSLAFGVLGVHLVDTIWLVMPALVRDPLSEQIGVPIPTVLLALVAVAGIGGVYVACFLGNLRKRSLVPLNDPAMDALEHAVHHEEEEDDELEDEHLEAIPARAHPRG